MASAPHLVLVRPRPRLGQPLLLSLGLHGTLLALSWAVAHFVPARPAPLQEPVLIVEPLYALPQDPHQLPDRPMAAPPPPAGDEGELEPPPLPTAMALPDPDTQKDDGQKKEPAKDPDRERKKREELERLANLERGDRDVAPTAENAIAPPDWSTWNPNGSATADPVIGRWVAEAKSAITRNLYVIDRGVVKDSAEFFVGVAVLIDREGTIVEYEVSRPSGQPRFDGYVKTALKRTRVLPRPQDKVWNALTRGQFEQGNFLVQLSGKDVSLQ